MKIKQTAKASGRKVQEQHSRHWSLTTLAQQVHAVNVALLSSSIAGVARGAATAELVGFRACQAPVAETQNAIVGVCRRAVGLVLGGWKLRYLAYLG